MRITQSMIARNILQSINRNRENLSKVQTSIATGKEVSNPSHDPARFSRASRLRSVMVRNEQYLRNIEDAQTWTQTTSSALNELYTGVIEAKEVAIQGANDTNSAQTRGTLAQRVEGILERLVALANSKHMGKYLFGGSITLGQAPFSYDGISVSYNSNTAAISRRVADNITVSININGQQLMDANFFTALISLRDGLNSNDTQQIQSALGDIEEASEDLSVLSTAIGSITNQLSLSKQRLETANVNLSSYLSQAEDVDMAEAITKFNSHEMAYRAALQSASSVVQLNLLEFMK